MQIYRCPYWGMRFPRWADSARQSPSCPDCEAAVLVPAEKSDPQDRKWRATILVLACLSLIFFFSLIAAAGWLHPILDFFRPEPNTAFNTVQGVSRSVSGT